MREKHIIKSTNSFEQDYKKQIIHLLDLIDEEKFLRYLYTLVKEMSTKNE